MDLGDHDCCSLSVIAVLSLLCRARLNYICKRSLKVGFFLGDFNNGCKIRQLTMCIRPMQRYIIVWYSPRRPELGEWLQNALSYENIALEGGWNLVTVFSNGFHDPAYTNYFSPTKGSICCLANDKMNDVNKSEDRLEWSEVIFQLPPNGGGQGSSADPKFENHLEAIHR